MATITKKATATEKQEKETRRQEVLLKHATSLYLNQDMSLDYASIVYENVKELMSVTKLNQERVVKYLNDAMHQGQDNKGLVEFTLNNSKIIHYVKDTCSKCGNEVKVYNGLEKLEDYDGETTCMVDYQLFYDKRKTKEGSSNPQLCNIIGRKTHIGLCLMCLPIDAVCYVEDLGEDVDLWNGELQLQSIKPTD